MSMEERATSVIGPLEIWERNELGKCSSNFGSACLSIAEMKETTLPRMMQWLKMSAEEDNEKGIVAYSGLLHGLNSDVKYKGDEAAWWVKRVRDLYLMKKVSSFDADGSRARRHVVRTLLSGSLSKNQDSVLYRSFFRSGLREVHLLPLISKYLIEEKREEREEREKWTTRTLTSSVNITSLIDISSTIFCDCSPATLLNITMRYDNQFLCFLPLLFSLIPNLSTLTIQTNYIRERRNVDLSLLQQVDTSRLEGLEVFGRSYESLSSLSLCDLSSLRKFKVHQFPKLQRLNPLNGLSSHITSSLKELSFFSSGLKDLSPLSHCDLSSLEILNLSDNRSLSDLSPLRGSDLSSLKQLLLFMTNISDLSPLCECKGLALEKMDVSETLIKDLSPLSLLDLSRLKEPVYLNDSHISDLSPLENISYDDISISVSGTPVVGKMKKKSPQTIGKVKVTWELWW